MKAAKISPLQENILMIRISKNVPGEEENFEKLWNRIQTSGDRFSVVLYGKE